MAVIAQQTRAGAGEKEKKKLVNRKSWTSTITRPQGMNDGSKFGSRGPKFVRESRSDCLVLWSLALVALQAHGAPSSTRLLGFEGSTGEFRGVFPGKLGCPSSSSTKCDYHSQN